MKLRELLEMGRFASMRRHYAGIDSDDKTSNGRFSFEKIIDVRDLDPLDDESFLHIFLVDVFRTEKDLAYKAIVANSDMNGVTIRTKYSVDQGSNYFGLKVRVRFEMWLEPVREKRVYIPVYEKVSMPSNTHKCEYCGGWTKDDKRGHCSGCGGPRDSRYLEEFDYGQ